MREMDDDTREQKSRRYLILHSEGCIGRGILHSVRGVSASI